MFYNVLIAWLMSDQGAHLSVDPFLRIVIMPKSSARFMWYCAFADQPDARPFQFRNKVGAMQFMRRNCGTPLIGTYTIRKTIEFKGHVGRGKGWGGGGGGICLSVS